MDVPDLFGHPMFGQLYNFTDIVECKTVESFAKRTKLLPPLLNNNYYHIKRIYIFEGSFWIVMKQGGEPYRKKRKKNVFRHCPFKCPNRIGEIQNFTDPPIPIYRVPSYGFLLGGKAWTTGLESPIHVRTGYYLGF